MSFAPRSRLTARGGLSVLVIVLILAHTGTSDAVDVIESPPAAAPHKWLVAARAHEAKKEFEAATDLYRRYLTEKPEDDEVRASLARVLSWQGRYDEAVTLYREILSRHPIDIDVRLALARVTAWQQHLTDAKTLYEAVLEDDPGNLDATAGLADVLLWSGRPIEALRLYEAIYARTGDPDLDTRIQSLKAELSSVTSSQAQRAPVGAVRRVPTIPFRDYVKLGYSHFTYTNKVPQEHDGRIEVGKAIGAQTLVGRLDQMNRFGFQDTQVSSELYSPL